jgi:hypothetical protein
VDAGAEVACALDYLSRDTQRTDLKSITWLLVGFDADGVTLLRNKPKSVST